MHPTANSCHCACNGTVTSLVVAPIALCDLSGVLTCENSLAMPRGTTSQEWRLWSLRVLSLPPLPL